MRSPSAPSNSSPPSAARANRSTFKGKTYTIEPIRPEAFAGVDIVLSSTPASVSRESSPMAAKAGAIVIDNSSAWRMDPDVPLVVPEVNADALRHIPKGIVANPNCSTIQMVVALKPLHDLAQIKRVVVSTYQASSGKGATGLLELDAQLAALGRGEPVPPAKAHAAQLAGNVLPHDWKAGEDGYTEEEWKMIRETQQDHGRRHRIQVSPTTARVPVRIGHSEAINLEFHKPITSEQAREALRSAPGIIVLDDSGKGEVPLPLHVDRPRRGVRRPHPPRSDGAARPESVGGGRQPPQGRGDQRGADRRGAGATRLAAAKIKKSHHESHESHE